MRITGHRMIELAAASTARSQEDVATRSAEMSSGLRVAKPSDDPTAWAAAERAKMRRTIAEGTGTAVEVGRDQLEQTDGALAALGDIVSQVRALAIQGSNGSYNAAARLQLGTQVQSLFDAALGAANTRSSTGEYLLAGSTSVTPPFDAAGVYQGDASARSIPATESSTAFASIPGSRLTAVNGVDVIPLLAQVATALSTNNLAALQTSIGDLETAVGQVSQSRTIAGSAMSVLDSTLAARDHLTTHLSSEIARNVEVDGVAAASALASASQSLEASRAVTAHLVSMLDPRAT